MHAMNEKQTANIELELSPSQTSQILIDTSVVSSGDLHGISLNSSTPHESHTTQQQQSHVTSGKKETNLLSWFTSSSSTTSSAMNNISVVSATSSASAVTDSPPVPSRYAINNSEHEHIGSQHDDSSSPSMKNNSKLSYGEKLISRFNKNGNKAASPTDQQNNTEQMTNTTAVPKHEQPQKSSRRTTSLLNLFMSNSQGNI